MTRLAVVLAMAWAVTTAGPGRCGAADLQAEFTRTVLRLAGESDHIDRLWWVYKGYCGVSVGASYGFGREWFALWDRAAVSARESPVCAEVLWQVLGRGEGVRRDLIEARRRARRTCLPLTLEMAILRGNRLEWAQ